jgi:hypothetical protein
MILGHERQVLAWFGPERQSLSPRHNYNNASFVFLPTRLISRIHLRYCKMRNITDCGTVSGPISRHGRSCEASQRHRAIGVTVRYHPHITASFATLVSLMALNSIVYSFNPTMCLHENLGSLPASQKLQVEERCAWSSYLIVWDNLVIPPPLPLLEVTGCLCTG